jgi:hypothetical protein
MFRPTIFHTINSTLGPHCSWAKAPRSRRIAFTRTRMVQRASIEHKKTRVSAGFLIGETVGIGLRPSRFRESRVPQVPCIWEPGMRRIHSIERVRSSLSLGRDALGLSHLTYRTTWQINLHRLDQPPFPCKPKLRPNAPRRQEPHFRRRRSFAKFFPASRTVSPENCAPLVFKNFSTARQSCHA